MHFDPFKWLEQQVAKRKNDASRETLKDKALARRLSRLFEHEMELSSVRGIHFYVQNGTVTLYGTIRNALDRDLLVSMVRQIAGVKGVKEHLQIVDPLFQHPQSEITA